MQGPRLREIENGISKVLRVRFEKRIKKADSSCNCLIREKGAVKTLENRIKIAVSAINKEQTENQAHIKLRDCVRCRWDDPYFEINPLIGNETKKDSPGKSSERRNCK